MPSIPFRFARALLILTALPSLAGAGAALVDRPAPFDPRTVIETVRRNRGETPRPATPNFAPAGAAPFAREADGPAVVDPRFKIGLEGGEVVGRLPDGRVGVRIIRVELDGALPGLRHAAGDSFSAVRPGLLRRTLGSGVSAHLLNRGRDGLELYWRLDERLSAPLSLTLTTRLPVAPREEAAGLVLPGPGGNRFTLTHLSAVDADGRRIEIRATIAAGAAADPAGMREYRLRYEIPGGFLAAARYPVVLDPTLGAEFPVDANPVTGAAPGTQGNPAVAWNGVDYLVAWQDDRAGSGTDIFAARVQPDGTLRDPAGILVSGAAGNQLDPVAASVSASGGSWLLLWRDFFVDSYERIYD